MLTKQVSVQSADGGAKAKTPNLFRVKSAVAEEEEVGYINCLNNLKNLQLLTSATYKVLNKYIVKITSNLEK